MTFNATCEDNMALMARYPDKFFDLAIVDPPYGSGQDWSKEKMNKGRYKGNYDNSLIPNSAYFEELFRVSKNWIIWGANYYTAYLVPTNNIIVWDKKAPQNNIESMGEIAYTSFKHPLRIIEIEWSGARKGILESTTKKIHPHQKPVALYKWLLANYAKPGDKILDTHLGSGSIAIACYDLGFDLTACELDPYYFKVMMKRYTDHVKSRPIIPGMEYVVVESVKQMKMFDTD